MKKLVSLVLASCLALSLFACGQPGSSSATSAASAASTGSAASTAAGADALAGLPEEYSASVKVAATPEMYANTDLSSDYTVNMYLIGDKPNDWEVAQEKINEYLEPFHTKIATTFMSWSDYTTMYSLVLAGGEQVDLIFTAPWCYMYPESAKGSFYELTQDFVSQSMPLSAKYQAKESWDETTISGKTIAVPSNVASPMGKIVAVRQDLMEKYNMTELNSWSDYMTFMKTIAEKETPESGIYALASAVDNNELWDVYRQQENTFLALDSNYMDMMYSYEEGKLPTKDQIKLAYEFDSFKQYCYDMKELADAGCWSRSALTNTITDDDAFGNLQGASIAWNASVYTYMEQAEKTEGVTCAAYDLTKENLVGAEAYSNNAMAITAGSGNPQRAAMVLDMLKFDTYLNRLVLLGIEGTHYSIDEEGQYTELEKATEFAANAVSVSWAVKNGDLEEAGQPQREKDMTEAWEKRVVMNPTVTFVFDDTEVKEYSSAVQTVLNDYVPMLELGLAEDVDATLSEMLQKCNEAGLDKVYESFYSQYDAWLATR